MPLEHRSPIDTRMPLALGCMSFHTLAQGRPIIHAALDAGIEFFDTADLYDQGENEAILGQLLQSKRQELIIATKVGNRWNADGKSWQWVPRKSYILKAVEESLKRLKTDYIDLYQLHGGTIDDPLEEVVEAFEHLKEQGKIRAYGISSIRPNTIQKWTALGAATTCMSQYSLLDRRPEAFILDHLQQAQQKMLVRGALAKGLLAGKLANNYLNWTEKEVADIQTLLKAYGQPNILAIALHYVLRHSAVSHIVLGASSATQLEQSISAWKDQQIPPAFFEQLLAKLPAANEYVLHKV